MNVLKSAQHAVYCKTQNMLERNESMLSSRFVEGWTKLALDFYFMGLLEGLARYAHWKDGTQYVGTCGTTLKAATDAAAEEAKAAMEGVCNGK